MSILFISDLHLSPSRPDITHCFVHFMQTEAIHAKALYVLGDLFDFWIGDDDPSEFAQQIKAQFHALTQQGVACYFVHGNRDFLLGSRFERETGVICLEQETIIELYGQTAVILHGDTLCTLDTRYQAYRKKVHQPWLQWLFNALPFRLKKRIVGKVQSDIREDRQQKPEDIMDVTPSEVQKVMKKHQVKLMIHGHTHRPWIHKTADHTRIVLGDWFTQGSVLTFTEHGYQLSSRQLQ